MKIRSINLFIVFFYSTFLFSQDDIIIKEFVVDDAGDTLLISNIPSIEVLSFKNYDEKTRYYILRRKVLKVYPYAIYTKNKLLEIEKDIESISRKRKKKKHINDVAEFLRGEFAQELKNLTMSEGNILVKLIYRETNISTYILLKQYRGFVNALFWQTMARIYDNDLKQEYDPVNNREDMFIEHIITQAKLEGEL